MLISDQKYYICSTDVVELERISKSIYQVLREQPDHRSITIEIRIETI